MCANRLGARIAPPALRALVDASLGCIAHAFPRGVAALAALPGPPPPSPAPPPPRGDEEGRTPATPTAPTKRGGSSALGGGGGAAGPGVSPSAPQ